MAAKAPHPDQVDRVKMECPQCGYKCFPQWMNNQAHCLKCDAVLKTRPSTGGYAAAQALPTAPKARPPSAASKLDTPIAPQPAIATPQRQPGLRDQEGREKMECPTCGYKSYPQWMNDEAHCLKCNTILKRRAVGGGAAPGSVGRHLASDRPSVTGTPASPQPAASTAAHGDGSLDSIFSTFAGAGKSDMDGKSFVKLCKDCRLIDKAFTATDADLIFAKVVPKGHRRIDLAQFERALGLIAQKKGVPADSIFSEVTVAGGPQYNATQTDAVRFHDDKSTYTGAHAHGGPEQVVKGLGTVGQ